MTDEEAIEEFTRLTQVAMETRLAFKEVEKVFENVAYEYAKAVTEVMALVDSGHRFSFDEQIGIIRQVATNMGRDFDTDPDFEAYRIKIKETTAPKIDASLN